MVLGEICRHVVGGTLGGGVNYCFINIERGLKFTDHISKSSKNEKERRN